MPQRSPYAHVWCYTPEYMIAMCRERYRADVPALKKEVERLKAQLRQRDDAKHAQQRLADDYRRRYEDLRYRFLRLQDEYGRVVRELREERNRNRAGMRR
ncbi:hypothetical protein LTR86_000401 [Recurvomyces mirabilis]|nr:hypothetical protein LTR86_000401 [Recurvomyces mirabilis]